MNGGADPLVRSRRPRRLASCGRADFVGKKRVQGVPPHHLGLLDFENHSGMIGGLLLAFGV